MSNYAIELEWERCPDGIEIVVRDEPPQPQGLLGALAGVRTTWRSGDNTEEEVKLLRQREQVAQVLKGTQTGWPPMGPRTGAQRWLRAVTPRRTAIAFHADKFDQPIAIEFVNATDEKALVQFVHRYGFPNAKNAYDSDGAALHVVEGCRHALEMLLNLHQRRHMSELVLLFEKLSADWTSTMFPRLTMSPGAESPQLTLRPSTLLGYMLLEAGMIMSGNTRLMRCVHCGKVFISGAHGGKRKTAIYCSNRCRVAEQRAIAKSTETGS